MPSLVAVEHGLEQERSLLEQLAAQWAPADEACVTLVEVDEDGLSTTGVRAVDGFLHSVGAGDDVIVVLVVRDWERGEQTLARLVEKIRSRGELWRLRTWVVGAYDREIQHPTKDALERLLATRAAVNLQGALVLAGSTAVKARLAGVDGVGMVADAVWALTSGRLAEHPNAWEQVRVWWVATESFTSWAPRAGAAEVARAVAEALDEGPLKPDSSPTAGHFEDLGRSWVDKRGIGTEGEYARLVADSRGDLFQLLRLEDSAAQLVPDAWAASADREYIDAAGAPLARVRRGLRANTQEILRGRSGSADLGHLLALQREVDTILRGESGVQRAARFLNGVADEVDRRAREVAARPRPHPEDLDPATARQDLVLALENLPEPRPWGVRAAVVGAIAAVIGASLAPAWAAALAGSSIVAMGMMLAGRRRRITKARLRYLEEAGRHLRAMAEEEAFTAWADLIERVSRHAGAFHGEMNEKVDIEQAVEPTAGSLAERLHRWWRACVSIRQALGSRTDHLEVLPTGQFTTLFPADEVELQALRQTEVRDVQQAVEEAAHQARDLLRDVSLSDDDPQGRLAGLMSVLELSVWTLPTLLDSVPAARQAARSTFAEPNRPAGPAWTGQAEPTSVVCGPPSVLAALALDGGTVSHSRDNGRLVRLWASPVMTAPPEPWQAPQVAPVPSRPNPTRLPPDPDEVGA